MIALGRFDAAEALLARAAESARRAGRPDMAYGAWVVAAVVASARGDHLGALAHVERGAGQLTSLPVLEHQLEGVRAYALARLGRHAEARAASDRQAELAERIGSPRLIALAEHDAGTLAVFAGDHERARELLGRALASDAPLPRTEARLRRAEALARLGSADEADAEIRAATLEPIAGSQRSAVLVARMAFAQGLSARARGDHRLAGRRFEEAAAYWQRLARDGAAPGEHLASLVDLGRPPVSGVVDPALELERVAHEQRVLPTPSSEERAHHA